MQGWKDKLDAIVQHKEREREAQARQADESLRRFIDVVVMPAFTELKSQMEQHGREVVIRRTPLHAVIAVFRDQMEEFSYGIRGRAYQRGAPVFPHISAEDGPADLCAEVLLYTGKQAERPLNEFTQAGIIEDFLKEYEKWGGW